jgi:hypothetical protein
VPASSFEKERERKSETKRERRRERKSETKRERERERRGEDTYRAWCQQALAVDV